MCEHTLADSDTRVPLGSLAADLWLNTKLAALAGPASQLALGILSPPPKGWDYRHGQPSLSLALLVLVCFV